MHQGGIASETPSADQSQHTYLPRCTVPVLMINGIYDGIFPFEATQEPMFELFPEGTRKRLLLEGGHSGFGAEDKAKINSKTLKWLDRHLGKPRRVATEPHQRKESL